MKEKYIRNEYWLVTTEHLKDKLLFKDEEDFKTGMNYVAVAETVPNLKVLAFILMSNHLHFILYCSKDTSLSFISRFKKLYSQYYNSKYKSPSLLRGNNVDIKHLPDCDEILEKAIAYVQMNSVAANICLHPSGYPWGTGNSFFNNTPQAGRLVGDFGLRARIRMFHSKTQLPAEYLVGNNEYILPESYVQVQLVESIFKTPRRMNFFLNNSSKAKLLKESPSFNDQLVMSACRDLSISLFRKDRLDDLSEEQAAEILKQLRYRFSSDPNQLSRITGIEYSKVCHLLESF